MVLSARLLLLHLTADGCDIPLLAKRSAGSRALLLRPPRQHWGPVGCGSSHPTGCSDAHLIHQHFMSDDSEKL